MSKFVPKPCQMRGPTVIKPAPKNGEVDVVTIGKFVAIRQGK